MADTDSASLRLPAPFVNQFQIVVTGSNVRIAFAEGFSGQATNYRSAVVMSESDARELAMSILSSLPVPNLFSTNALSGMMTQPHPNGLLGGLGTLGTGGPGLIPAETPGQALARALTASLKKKS